jgi:hypothetical protein
VGTISVYLVMEGDESLRKEEVRKKPKTHDFAYLEEEQ